MAEALRQRKPRERNKDYLGFIAGLKCVLCGDEPECAHVRYTEACPECDGQGFWIVYPPVCAGPDPRQRYCHDCRAASYRYGKRPTGAGEKPSDWWTLPLCPVHHRLGQNAQHNSGERAWWEAQGIDPLYLCTRLQDCFNASKSRSDAIQAGLAVLENVRTN